MVHETATWLRVFSSELIELIYFYVCECFYKFLLFKVVINLFASTFDDYKIFQKVLLYVRHLMQPIGVELTLSNLGDKQLWYVGLRMG